MRSLTNWQNGRIVAATPTKIRLSLIGGSFDMARYVVTCNGFFVGIWEGRDVAEAIAAAQLAVGFDDEMIVDARDVTWSDRMELDAWRFNGWKGRCPLDHIS
jgi:hypothetical protein